MLNPCEKSWIRKFSFSSPQHNCQSVTFQFQIYSLMPCREAQTPVSFVTSMALNLSVEGAGGTLRRKQFLLVPESCLVFGSSWRRLTHPCIWTVGLCHLSQESPLSGFLGHGCPLSHNSVSKFPPLGPRIKQLLESGYCLLRPPPSGLRMRPGSLSFGLQERLPQRVDVNPILRKLLTMVLLP